MSSLQIDRAWMMPLIYALQRKERTDRWYRHAWRRTVSGVLREALQGHDVCFYFLNDVPAHILVSIGYDGREGFIAVLLGHEGLIVGELPIGKILKGEEGQKYLPQPRELAMAMFGDI